MVNSIAANPHHAWLHRLLAAYIPLLDTIIRGLLYVYVFSLPFKNLLFVERNGFIILLILLGLWCAINRRLFFLPTPVDAPLAVLVAWVIVGLPFSENMAYSLKEFGKLLQQVLIFYVIVYFFRETRDRNYLMMLLLIGMAMISVYGIWQFEMKEWHGLESSTGRTYFLIQSFLSSEAWLTTYLVTMIPLGAAIASGAVMPWHRMCGLALTANAVVCQFLTFSRAGVVALLAEALVFIILVANRFQRIVAMGLVMAVLLGAFTLVVVYRTSGIDFAPGQAKFTTYNLEARIKVWTLGLEMLVQHPLVGIGYGPDIFAEVTKEHPDFVAAQSEEVPMPNSPHNTVLVLGVGSGIPAALAYVWLFWVLFRQGVRRFRSETAWELKTWSLALAMMAVGLFVRNSFDHLWLGTMAELFWVFVGLAVTALTVPAMGKNQPRSTGSGIISLDR